MIRSCIKRLTLLANLAGKGNLLVLTLLLVVLSSLILVFQAIYTREQAGAAPNTNINFQARILKSSGALVADGNYSIQFKIYDTVAGPTSQWNETQTVTVKNGYVSVSLGSVNPFSGIDWSQEQWLTMNINGDGEMAPRMKVTAVPVALRANQADSLTNGSGTISASSLAQLAPGSVQGVTSANTAIRISQLGAGGLLQLQNGGGDKFTVANNGDTNIGGALTVGSGITVGNSSSTTAGTIRWTGAVFEGYNGTAWSSLGGSALGNPIINKVKLANEVQNSTVNATASLQNDDELFFNIGANETWTFRYQLHANANINPDFKFAVTAPAGATCKIGYSDPEGATSISNLGCGVSSGLVAGNTADDFYEIVGTITNGATAGTVQLLWAQNTANAANSTVYAGSSVLATRSVGPNGSAQAFIQNGNSFGVAAFLGTNDNNNLNFITNGTTKMTVLASGNVGIGDSTPNSLLTVGTADAFQVDSSGNVSTNGSLTVSGLSTFNNSLVAGATATGTVSNTEPTPRTNVTNVITTTAVFANNDVIFINNAGQDYYTRVVSGGGTTNLVVSPAVSYDASATVTKYQVQNIGATATNYSSQTNRFFQGYFLGGVVIGAGSTTISDGNIDSTTTLHLQQNGGALEIGGTLSVAGAITGDGSGLTNINGAQITSGSIADTSLSSNVTLAGNSFNGANQLVQLNGSGALPVLSGANLTNLSGSNITTGTLSDSILSSNVTLAGNTFNGASQLLRLNAGGTVDDSLLSTNITALGNSFNGINQLVQLNGSGALPALSGSNLTNLNASNIATGTIGDTRLSGNVTLAGNTFNGINQLVQLNGSGSLPVISGANLTNLNATNITSGTLDNARLNSSVTTAGNVFNGVSQLVQLNASGQLPALSAVNLTNLNASNIASGTLSDSILSGNVTLAGNSFNGISQLLQLNTSGKVDDSLLSTNITAQGNTFNGINQLVQLNASGALPALSGANLTSINGSNISSGTINNSRLSASVTLAGNSFNGVSQLVQLNASGALPALSGANLTSLSASNITSGTLDNARLNTNVTTAGNTFNGVSQLVQLNASGQLPALSGVNLTNINASNIASGTLSDTRLSGNVTLAGNSFNGVSQLVQLNASGALPVLSGVNLTNLNASNISSGTLDNARLTSSVTLAGNTFNGVSQLVQLNASGALPSLNAANLTSLNATSIASGTLSDTRLSGNVTLAGNTFNGVSQLVQLNASGALPSLSGINLTSLNASNIASGTLNDGRLSGNVVLLNANQIFTGTNQFNSSLTANGAASFNGNTTIGDASGDIITLNSSTMTLNNNLNIGSNSLYIDSTNKWLGINTASAQNRLTINTPNTSDAAAQVFIYTNANANKGLVVQGTASQSGNLQEWQLSGGSAPTIVNSAGQIVSSLNLAATGLANNVSSNNSLVQTTTTGTIVSTALASSVTLTLQNTNASPTGDLLQLKNSGGVAISQFNSSGQLILGNDAATPVAGVIQLNDATAANSFRINLSTASNLTASRNITLPDEAGTVCLSNSNNCGYIRLASGAAQTDSTTNDSIYINKTGASGDLITLQKNAVDVFRVANDGSLEIRQTSTTALSIKNSGGTDFFGVDTSGAIVRIGSATADGTGTLLVLDTKNTTGDPAGVNGGSYYNSADGKSRCYENGTWSDCSTTRVAGETTLGAASATISVSLNGNYEYLECRVDIKSRSVANMVYVRFNNDTGAAAYGWNAYGIVAAAPVDWQDASDSEIQLPGTQTGTNPFSADLKITNFADTNKVVDWTAAGVEPVNTNSNRYSGVGGYYNTTAQITSVQFVSSGGTFAAGSHAWCQGKNIR